MRGRRLHNQMSRARAALNRRVDVPEEIAEEARRASERARRRAPDYQPVEHPVLAEPPATARFLVYRMTKAGEEELIGHALTPEVGEIIAKREKWAARVVERTMGWHVFYNHHGKRP